MGYIKSVINVPKKNVDHLGNNQPDHRLVILTEDSGQGLNSAQVMFLKKVLEEWLIWQADRK